MRYQLIAGEDPRGMVVRPQATGGATKDGTVVDGCFDLVVETGKSFKGHSWLELEALAAHPGYFDSPD